MIKTIEKSGNSFSVISPDGEQLSTFELNDGALAGFGTDFYVTTSQCNIELYDLENECIGFITGTEVRSYDERGIITGKYQGTKINMVMVVNDHILIREENLVVSFDKNLKKL